MMVTLHTDTQVVSEFGTPTGIDYLNPGQQKDEYALNWLKREDWNKYQQFYPPMLIDKLPSGTKIINYDFSYPVARTGGALLIYINSDGRILGWSYSKSLVGLEEKAVLSEAR